MGVKVKATGESKLNDSPNGQHHFTSKKLSGIKISYPEKYNTWIPQYYVIIFSRTHTLLKKSSNE